MDSNRLYLETNVYINTHIHAITFDEKEAMNLKNTWEAYMQGLEGGKRRTKCCN